MAARSALGQLSGGAVIFLLLSRRDWEARDTDEVARPGEEGFVHCCDGQQIAGVRRKYFSPFP